MSNLRNVATLFANPALVRVIYVLLAIVAMALAGGAPDGFSGN
jgi:hypothetical protein